MKTLEIIEQDALAAYAKGSESDRKLLKNLFPNQGFDLKITDRVKSYEDACEIKGIKPLTVECFSFLPENQRNYQFCVHKYDVINEVLNEGWSPDWFNGNEYKYYPYFYWDKDKLSAGGSGFSFDDSYCDFSFSAVGSRLVFRTAELSDYAGKQFMDIHLVLQSPRTR